MTNISGKYRDSAKRRMLESADVKKKVAEECLESILAASQLIVDTFELGGKVMICGNGGSAADSQHMAGEFICTLGKEMGRSGLPAIALTTDTSVLTAHANDLGFQDVYKRQVDALGKDGDLVIGISTSGMSLNVLAAIASARQGKMKTILLTGNNQKTKRLADIVINVPSSNTQYIQESHLTIEHTICELVEQAISFSKTTKK